MFTVKGHVNHHRSPLKPELSADASEIGLEPGQWPDAIEYEGVRFDKTYTIRSGDGDVRYVEYWSGEGAFNVYND